MTPDTTIKRPAIKYYGGKFNIADWIISFFPAHESYLEPCGGAASVLLRKPRSRLETYNDLDLNVVTFFRVLRDRPGDLIRKIHLTPFSRTEFLSSLDLSSEMDDVERARLFFIRSSFAIGRGLSGQSTGMRFSTIERAKAAEVNNPHEIEKNLFIVAERLVGVQIENKPYIKLIDTYSNATNLTYFDPPYVGSERAEDNVYAFEWTNDQHIEAAQLLNRVDGYVIVSGYACELYTQLYESIGWSRFDLEAQVNGGGKRIESLWLSPRTVEALNMPRQGSLL